MRTYITILTFILLSLSTTGQTEKQRFSYTTTIGTGIPMSKPSIIPVMWQLAGYYNITSRFSLGAGTGLSVYEKILLPLYGNVKFQLTKPLKFTPYLECATGYAFVPSKKASGGFYLSPSAGGTFKLYHKIKMQVAIGYECQRLDRLKKFSDSNFSCEFTENLNHHSIVIKAGICF